VYTEIVFQHEEVRLNSFSNMKRPEVREMSGVRQALANGEFVYV